MTEPEMLLGTGPQHVDPTPEFRSAVTALIDATLGDVMAVTAPAPVATPERATGAADVAIHSSDRQAGRRRKGPLVVLALVAAAAVLLVTTFVVRDLDSSPQPSDDSKPQSTLAPPPSTAAPTTTAPFDEALAAAIAEGMLLSADDFAPGWETIPFKEVVLDRDLAATVPGCADALDTVFESPERTAVTAWRHFSSPIPAVVRQYVVVFPNEADAQAMFDDSTAPGFDEGCFWPYYRLTAENTERWCCDINDPATPPLYGVQIESERTHEADAFSLRVDDAQYWIDAEGVEHGPETFRAATIRIGRTIIVIETILFDELGNPAVSIDEFHDAIDNAINRANAALAASGG